MSKNELIILLFLVTTGIFVFKLWGLYQDITSKGNDADSSGKYQNLPQDTNAIPPGIMRHPGVIRQIK